MSCHHSLDEQFELQKPTKLKKFQKNRKLSTSREDDGEQLDCNSEQKKKSTKVRKRKQRESHENNVKKDSMIEQKRNVEDRPKKTSTKRTKRTNKVDSFVLLFFILLICFYTFFLLRISNNLTHKIESMKSLDQYYPKEGEKNDKREEKEGDKKEDTEVIIERKKLSFELPGYLFISSGKEQIESLKMQELISEESIEEFDDEEHSREHQKDKERNNQKSITEFFNPNKFTPNK
jgi:hypothetical protein